MKNLYAVINYSIPVYTYNYQSAFLVLLNSGWLDKIYKKMSYREQLQMINLIVQFSTTVVRKIIAVPWQSKNSSSEADSESLPRLSILQLATCKSKLFIEDELGECKPLD